MTVPKIPEVLADLGEVFVPVEPGEKGPTVPRDDEHLMAADDEIMQAYLRAGHGYAIAMQGDLAALDADEPDALAPIVNALPETAWQVSGSRTSEHYLLRVPGLDADIPLDHPRTGEHVGHIKAAPQSVIIGPGSRHSSGNRYGPLRNADAGIAELSEGELRTLVGPYARDELRVGIRDAVVVGLADASDTSVESILPVTTTAVDPFLDGCGPTTPTRAGAGGSDVKRAPVDIGIYDVISSGSFPAGTRTEHPFHGSDTGSNFMVHADGETWACWRNCGNAPKGVTAGHAGYLLGMDVGVISCGDWVGGGLDSDTWREIFDAAREQGYDIPTPEESIRKSPDIARCPDCGWALGEHRRDPFDPEAYRCGRCEQRVPEDEAFAHAE